jgi:hypothetical protein
MNAIDLFADAEGFSEGAAMAGVTVIHAANHCRALPVSSAGNDHDHGPPGTGVWRSYAHAVCAGMPGRNGISGWAQAAGAAPARRSYAGQGGRPTGSAM